MVKQPIFAQYHLGVFATAEEAHGAYASFKKEHVDVC